MVVDVCIGQLMQCLCKARHAQLFFFFVSFFGNIFLYRSVVRERDSDARATSVPVCLGPDTLRL